MKKNVWAALCVTSLLTSLAGPIAYANQGSTTNASSSLSEMVAQPSVTDSVYREIRIFQERLDAPNRLTTRSAIQNESLAQDLEFLYRDLSHIPTQAGSHTGGVSALNENAFVVAASIKTTPFIAGARFGQGRVIVAGDEDFINLSRNDSSDMTTVTRNLLLWLTEQGQAQAAAGSTTRYADAIQGKGKLRIYSKGAVPVHPSLPIHNVSVTSWTGQALDPTITPVAIVNATITDQEAYVLEQYVREGGNVVVALKGWVLQSYPEYYIPDVQGSAQLSTHYPVQRLLNTFGLSLLDNTADSDGVGSPRLSADQSRSYQINHLLRQLKAVEENRLYVEDLAVGEQAVSAEDKLVLVSDLLRLTFTSLTERTELRNTLEQESERLQHQITLPLYKVNKPYSSAILSYAFNTISLDTNRDKSPLADQFPGKVASDAPRVNDQRVTVNFDYYAADELRMYAAPVPWVSTGLYAPAGEDIIIDVPAGTPSLEVMVGTHTDTLLGNESWERAPIVSLRHTLQPGKNRINSPYGGLIYFIPAQSQTAQADVTVNGAVRAPYFDLATTSEKEWRESIRYLGAPWAELRGKRILLTVPADEIRHLENPAELLQTWDSLLDQFDKLNGTGQNKPLPHRAYHLPFHLVADKQISGGYMHAGAPIMYHIGVDSQDAVSIEGLKNNWGFWHEIGHNYQQDPWTWKDNTEVTVNIFSLYAQQYFGKPSRLLEKDYIGKSAYDYANAYIALPNGSKRYGDSKQLDLIPQLVMIKQLQMAYGWDFYTKLFTAYRELPQVQLPEDEQQEKDLFVVMASKHSGTNLLPFFEKWGFPFTDDARAQVNALQLPALTEQIWLYREDVPIKPTPKPDTETSGDGNSEVVTPSVPAWQLNKAYVKGNRVSYEGEVYEAKWWTRGESPGKNIRNEWQSAWKLI
ncbi:M60 family metallopeptidase [Paenibacillus sp. SC116]|uniref:M60 family metallopeptidase n=1 Tax=Paenibacillus sp. SC116 TaxID=2968986 RepID=UPI00215A82D7|nr:M60 family metallopeptidase [Paenibacillus sp. SC116]MCR8844028.1 M60 family metallopeptidase [Paenibacillus sp. SC116]